MSTRAAVVSVVLVAGALFYLARPTDPAAVGWAEHAGAGRLAHAVTHLREAVFATLPAPSWLRGSASDFAYAFALGALFGGARRAILAVGAAFALSHEIGQGLGWFAGTFDVLDLAVLSVAFAAGAALYARARPSAPPLAPAFAERQTA